MSAPNKKKVKFSTWFYFPKYLVYNSKAVMDDQMEYKDFKINPLKNCRMWNYCLDAHFNFFYLWLFCDFSFCNDIILAELLIEFFSTRISF